MDVEVIGAINDIVIIGGGIHGASIAFYLMKRGVRCTIIEEIAIASGASGKAAGFLAKNWGNEVTCDLHQHSYELHYQLAQELSLTSYRQLPTMKVSRGQTNSRKRRLDTEVPVCWIDKHGVVETMDSSGTAQVCPLELTTKLIETVVAFGSTVLQGRVGGVSRERGAVTGVRYSPSFGSNEVFLPATKAVIATGPWAGVHAHDWLGLHIPIQGIKSTSIVYKNSPVVVLQNPFVLFCDEDENGCDLEIYPRPNGEIYVCGSDEAEVLGGDQLRMGGEAWNASMVQPNIEAGLAATRSFSALSSIGERWADVTQACLRPITPDGHPVMGALLAPGCEGAYISAGHNCWGILWSPMSGLCMSEVILDGACSSMDLTAFRPERFA